MVTRARAQASGLAARLARAGRRGGRGARDPDRAAAGDAERRPSVADRRLRPRLPHEPERRRLLFDALEPPGTTRARSPAPRVAAIGPGTAAELARARDRADVVPERSIAEALRRGARGRAGRGRARAGAARRGGARRAARRARRARRARSTSCRSTTPCAEPLGDGSASALAARRLRDLHLELRPCASSSRPAARRARRRARRVDRPGDQRDARASSGSTVHVEAERHDIDGLVDALLRATPTRA